MIRNNQEFFAEPPQYDIVKKETGSDGITIEFRETEVNQSNINFYREGKIPFTTGFTKENLKDYVVIYRYKLSPKTTLDQKYIFDIKFGEYLKNKNIETKTIFHEKKHYKNSRLGHPKNRLSNLSEIGFMLGLEEFSAFSEMHLCDVPNLSQDNVVKAASQVMKDFIGTLDFYIEHHFDNVLVAAAERFNNNSLKESDFAPLGLRQSSAFEHMANSYLTFGGVCCWGLPNNSFYANEVNNGLLAIRYAYMQKFAQINKYNFKHLFDERIGKFM